MENEESIVLKVSKQIRFSNQNVCADIMGLKQIRKCMKTGLL